jgi:hypothetical protein
MAERKDLRVTMPSLRIARERQRIERALMMLCNGGEPHPLAVSCVTGDQKAFC